MDGKMPWENIKYPILQRKVWENSVLDGEWELIRKNDNPKGSFTYIFQKIENNWLIISDYTTDEYYP